MSIFQSTRPSRASTINGSIFSFQTWVFQSTRPSRASTVPSNISEFSLIFQSTRPSRASTFDNTATIAMHTFQSTRPSRASTPSRCRRSGYLNISIHKALTGLDQLPKAIPLKLFYFNPQGPHGPRLPGVVDESVRKIFQSTRPSRASTFSTSY